jgi:hypothetical protein
MQIEKNIVLSEELDEHSRAEVSMKLNSDNGYLNNSFSVSAHADPHAEDNAEVWLTLRVHDYTAIGNDWNSPRISRAFDLLSQHISRAEAEALVAVLSHELKKFKVADEAIQPVFV